MGYSVFNHSCTQHKAAGNHNRYFSVKLFFFSLLPNFPALVIVFKINLFRQYQYIIYHHGKQVNRERGTQQKPNALAFDVNSTFTTCVTSTKSQRKNIKLSFSKRYILHFQWQTHFLYVKNFTRQMNLLVLNFTHSI